MDSDFRKDRRFAKKHKSVDGFIRKDATTPFKLRPHTKHENHPKEISAKVFGNDDINKPRTLIDNFAKQDGFNPQSNKIGFTENTKKTKIDRHIDGSLEGAFDLPEDNKKSHRFRLRLRRPSLRSVLKSVVVLAILSGLMAGGIFAKGWWAAHKVFQGGAQAAVSLTKNADPSLLKAEGDGRVNILLIGKGGETHVAGDLTDTILVASVDPTGKTAALLSIPRDLYVKYPNYGSMKINAVYSTAKQSSLYNASAGTGASQKASKAEDDGISQLKSVITSTIGIPIHYYVMVDFTAFKEAVDTVGGIDITLDQAIYDPNFDWQYGRNILKLPAGPVHLDGLRATLLGRSRGAAGGYGVVSDFDRNENQRKMLVALKEKIVNLGTLSNPVKINQLLSNLANHVRTNLSTGELVQLYNIGKDIQSSNIASIGFTDEKSNFVTTQMIDGQSIVRPRAGLYDYSEIQNFVRNTLRDGYLASENARVVILNGSGIAGLASKKSTELKSFGYNVTKVGDAAVAQEKTLLVDLTGGVKKYTKRYLELRTGLTSLTSLPSGFSPEDTDFVIILGANEANSQ